jgi:hypothetical protein
MDYEILENGYIKKSNDDGSVTFIPNDPANSDYAAYLETLDEAAPL